MLFEIHVHFKLQIITVEVDNEHYKMTWLSKSVTGLGLLFLAHAYVPEKVKQKWNR